VGESALRALRVEIGGAPGGQKRSANAMVSACAQAISATQAGHPPRLHNGPATVAPMLPPE
jgi:hypothetical protein